MSSERNVLYVQNLRKSFKNRVVVNGVDLTVSRGEIVGLLGANGAGKSTTFYMMVGRILPDSGQVMISENDVTSLPMYMRARMGIGYLPQEASIFRRLNVLDNLRLVLAQRGIEEPMAGAVCDKLVDELGLGHIATEAGYALSGGERRRVEIARCLAMDPSFILLDEPFSGIDPVAVADLQEVISDLRARGYGILLTDHNVRETLAITDRTYIMHQGSIVVDGPPDVVANDPRAIKYYLGDRFEW
ncbi:MAG: LPS export ABC transporter ATP-binding protein [Synergistaceae bacterium]|jgi:lipopolysaccharide export system ATP-binding protein|nr:LPS export ABC transporter ATP-binding protein [Synergistaceae bacterium]